MMQGIAIGPILFVIAILAVLVGAISSGSGTGNDVSPERAKILAAQIINQAQQVKNAVDRVRANGCSDEEISFQNGVVSGYTNANATLAEKPWCHVFQPSGGGMTWQVPQNLNWTNSGQWRFNPDSRVIGFGTDAAELIMFVGTPASPSSAQTQICLAVNDLAGVTNTGGVAPLDNYVTGTFYTGSFPSSPTVQLGERAELLNKSFGCARASDGGLWIFQVLVTR